MKTYLAFVCAAALVIFAAGCGGQVDDSAAVPTAAQANVPATSPASPPPPSVAAASAAGSVGKKVTLYRDTWGVPHVYADTYADAAFALGYAQAEDRLKDIYENVRTAVGTMAEAFGEKYVTQDYMMQLARNAEICQEYWKTAPEHIRAMGDNFMAGVHAYVTEHPEKKPETACELAGWQCAAIGRAMILQWPVGTIMDDLKNKGEAPAFGSNAFAIAPSRSAEGCAILMTDPHLTWEGMAVFTEASVHAADGENCGFFLVGSPMPVLGHSSHVAWACTTGGPDTSDVYMVKLNPENAMQYQYDGEWKDFEMKEIEVKVKGGQSVIRPAFYSIYGPVVEEPDLKRNIAYCGASPYLKATRLFEQMYKMSLAKSCDDFYEGLALNQMMEQNLLFADRDGNIQYVRNGCTPIRPDGYNWNAPVPGGTDATKWLGIHDIKDLVQCKNPPQGYFQNCNVSPQEMMKDSPMTPEKYKPYIYNVNWDKNSPRGRRLLELLDADSSITKEEAMEYTLNVYDILTKPWQTALKAAMDAVGANRERDPEFMKAVNGILNFDGMFVKESTVAPIIRFWRVKCDDKIDVAAVADGRALPIEEQKTMLDLLAEALNEMKAKYGTLDVKWGDITLVGRGGRFFACDGSDFGRGRDKKNQTETVMDVAVREEEKGSGKYIAFNGSSTIMLSFLKKDGIESYSLVAWGQSGNPDSPHYVDQAERLYSQRKFKPTYFKKEELLKNIESEKVLTIQ